MVNIIIGSRFEAIRKISSLIKVSLHNHAGRGVVVIVSILVLDDLVKDRVDLVLETDLELLLHAVVQVVLLAEVFSQRLGRVALIDDNLLDAVLGNVHLNVELGIAFIDLLAHIIELLVHQVFVVLLVDQLGSMIRVSRLELVELLVIDWVDLAGAEVNRLGKSLGGNDMSRRQRLLCRADLGRIVSPKLFVATVHGIGSRRDLPGLLHTLGGRVGVPTLHKLLELLLLTSFVHLVDVLHHSVVLKVVHFLLLSRSLVDVGREAALLSGLLVLVVDRVLVSLLAGTRSHQVQVRVHVTGRRATALGQAARLVQDAGLQGQLLGKLGLLSGTNLLQAGLLLGEA